MSRRLTTNEDAAQAATAAANCRMRSEGRTKWNREDTLHASAVFHVLAPNNEPLLPGDRFYQAGAQ